MTWGRNDLETKWPGGEMTGNHTSKLNCSSCRGVALRLTPETCRFKGEDDFKDEIWLKVFSLILKKHTPRKATLYFFTPEKLAQLFLLKEVYLPPDRKMIKLLHLTTCFRHYDILAKSREKRVINWRGISRFSRQNDAGACARIT